MKKTILLPLLFAFGLFVGTDMVNAQAPCAVDPQYTSPGIYPSDTLPDIPISTAYNAVVQFVFPPDTVVGGFTIAFDSFVVTQVTGLPGGINWDCDQNQNNCTYYTAPPSLTRGCVAIDGMVSMQNPAFPAYDSVVVTGVGWVTLPFVGAQSFPQDISVFWKTTTMASINDGLGANLDLQVAPNPSNGISRISYFLSENAEVEITVNDMYGQKVAVLGNGWMNSGSHEVQFNSADFPAGIYFVRANVNGGEYVKAKKVITFH